MIVYSQLYFWGKDQEQISAARYTIRLLLRLIGARNEHVAIHIFAHIAKLDEVLDEYALFIIAQTLLATTLYTELFQ